MAKMADNRNHFFRSNCRAFLILIAVIMLMFIMSIAISACHRQLTKQQAMDAAKRFVSTNVVFYSANSSQNDTYNSSLPAVHITVADAYLKGSEWHVVVHVQSNATGQLKTRGMDIPIDSGSGGVIASRIEKFSLK